MNRLSARAMPALRTPVILYVDDELGDLNLIKSYLQGENFNLINKSSPKEALSYIKDPKKPLDLLISDSRMPGMSGIELVNQAKKYRPDLTTVGVTRYPDSEESNKLKQTADFWVEKTSDFCRKTAVLVRKALVKHAIDAAMRHWYDLESNNIHVSPDLVDDPNFQEFMLQRERLERLYPDHYVAFVNGKFAGHDADKDALLDRVYKSNEEPVDVFIQKLAKPRIVHLRTPQKVNM